MGSLEGTNGLAFDGGLDAGLEGSFLHEIHWGAQNLCDPVLNVDHIEERKLSVLVESGEQIDIGSGS
jgi:hypothetical protein